jgi:hypothetical protein
MRSPRSNNDTTGLGTSTLRKENHLKVVNKETTKVRNTNPLVIIVEN